MAVLEMPEEDDQLQRSPPQGRIYRLEENEGYSQYFV
jgi:hypothetical protein